MISKPLRALKALASGRVAFETDLIPLVFDDLPRKKILNWILTETSVHVRPARPWGLPTILQVEPTSRCNLRCTVCPCGAGMDRPAGDMDPEVFRRLIDELSGSVLLLMFWDWGEPFLHPKACEMIGYARNAGMKVIASTNGHVFSSREHARRVVESGLDALVFSIDGISQGTYQRYRAEGRLEQVLAGIRNVVEAKRTLGVQVPVVNFRFIVMRHNQHEIPLLKEFAGSLGVDVLSLRKFHAVPDHRLRSRWLDAELVPRETKFQIPALSPDDLQPVRSARNPCRNPWNCPTVHWNGTVCSCFMDFDEQRPLGSLAEESFRSIWYGERYRRLRSAFRRRWRDVPLCGECALGFEGGDVGQCAVAEAFFFQQPRAGASS
jgi:MoaA/NifB/PqqE/SkfB family radical SAM enzyme